MLILIIIMITNNCKYCGKELGNIVVRHHIDQEMKLKNPKRYGEYRPEDIELLCSLRCHKKTHEIKIFDYNGIPHTKLELLRKYDIKNKDINSRISMSQKRGQIYFKIKKGRYLVPQKTKNK